MHFRLWRDSPSFPFCSATVSCDSADREPSTNETQPTLQVEIVFPSGNMKAFSGCLIKKEKDQCRPPDALQGILTGVPLDQTFLFR